ncbi:MAG: hypothetical protein WA840_22625 [Caulobacteraceae bacterium]
MHPADETPSERNARRPGFIIGPAATALVVIWITAFTTPHAHRFAAAAAITGIILMVVGVGLYLGRLSTLRRK